jgi:hypothetical protein
VDNLFDVGLLDQLYRRFSNVLLQQLQVSIILNIVGF